MFKKLYRSNIELSSNYQSWLWYSRIKVYSYRVKVETKANISFMFVVFRFRLRFRSMWTDLKYCMLVGTFLQVSKQSTIMPIHEKNTKGFEKAFISEDGDRYQLITVIIVEQHTKQMKYNP